jgi:predicted transcriptional regulator
MHMLDDLTENTFLSAMKGKTGEELSLLNRIGPRGMIVISDLTGIFSKPSEARAAILSQLRMIYDGEMTKHSGSKGKPISWKGQLGIIAGSTPSIYKKFEEVAMMGERFMYYRLKDYGAENAGKIALNRVGGVDNTNKELAELYDKYLKEVVLYTMSKSELVLSDVVKEHLIQTAMLAERIRTVAGFDWKNEVIINIPIPAMPMRTALQLAVLAKSLLAMKRHETKDDGVDLGQEEFDIIDWCAYSLANEEKRACLRVLATLGDSLYTSTASVSDVIGLPTHVTRSILQVLAAVKVVDRSGNGDGLTWRIANRKDKNFIRRVENVAETVLEGRQTSLEDVGENNEEAERIWNKN